MLNKYYQKHKERLQNLPDINILLKSRNYSIIQKKLFSTQKVTIGPL